MGAGYRLRSAASLAGRQTSTSVPEPGEEPTETRRGRAPAPSPPTGGEGGGPERSSACIVRFAGRGDAARVVTQRKNSSRFLRSSGLLRSAVRCSSRSLSVLRRRLSAGRTPGAGPGAQVQGTPEESGPTGGAGAGTGTFRRSLADDQRWGVETLLRSLETFVAARPHVFDPGRRDPIFSRPN